jgi:hypothetical protein
VLIETLAYKNNVLSEWTKWPLQNQVMFWLAIVGTLGCTGWLVSKVLTPERKEGDLTPADQYVEGAKRWVRWMNFGANSWTYAKQLGLGLVVLWAVRWLYLHFIELFGGYDKMTEGQLLLGGGPTSLSTVSVAGSYEELNRTDKPIYSYGISCWVWVNAFPHLSTKVFPVLQYGNMVLMQYSPEHNTMSVWTRPTAEDSFRPVCHINKWALQSWVYIVINHTGSTMDVFVDGVLRKTIPHALSYVQPEDMLIGAEYGVNGDIRELRYSTHPIKLSTIQWENNVGRWITP